MRRHLKAALAIAIASTSLIAVTAAPANAATASLYFEDGVLYSGCFDIPYQFTLDLPSGTSTWSYDLSITKPDGTEIASDFNYGTGRIGTLSTEILLCGSDDAGDLTATGTVEAEGSYGTEEVDFMPTTFTMRRPLSQTTAKLAAKPKCGKTVRINTTTLDERPNGFFPAEFGEVALERKVKGKWRPVEWSEEFFDDGVAQLEIVWTKAKKTKTCAKVVLRAVTLYDSDYREVSFSTPITLG